VTAGTQQVQDTVEALSSVHSSVQQFADQVAHLLENTGSQAKRIVSVKEQMGELDRMTHQNVAVCDKTVTSIGIVSDHSETLGDLIAHFVTSQQSQRQNVA